MQIHKFSAPDRRFEGMHGEMETQSSFGGDKTYTRDKEIRLGINFKWDAYPVPPLRGRPPAVDAT